MRENTRLRFVLAASLILVLPSVGPAGETPSASAPTNAAAAKPGLDPIPTVDDAVETMVFWVIARVNICTYWQGSQETDLGGDGVKEATIAALAGDWPRLTPAQRAAFAFTCKLTFEPNAIGDSDIGRLRAHYKDVQILEIVMAASGFNAASRRLGPLAIPQEGDRAVLPPAPQRYQSLRSRIAPLDPAAIGMACARSASRGALEPREQVETALSAARKRSPRLVLATDAQARAVLPNDWLGSEPVPQWVCLLGHLPEGGKRLVASTYRAQTKGKLSLALKAKIAWVCARDDRAWYALGHARRRLNDLGLTDDQVFALDRPDSATTPAEQAALALVRKITVDPALITKADVATLRTHYSDAETAEVVDLAAQAASFDRLTEAAGLRLEY